MDGHVVTDTPFHPRPGPVGAVAGSCGGLGGIQRLVGRRRSAGSGRSGRRAGVRQFHRSRFRLGSRLGNVPVRGVRGGAAGPDLEADPGLLLPRHYAWPTCPRAACSRSGSPATPTAPSGSCRRRASTCGTASAASTPSRRAPSTRPGGSAARFGIPAELPHRRRPRRYRADRSDQGHLVVLQPRQDRPGHAAERVGADLPRIDGAGQWGSTGRTINRVLVEDYVRGVVPAEMPTSWPAEAVRAQAVAARSYAVRLRANRRYPSYDLCDTTACQVYRGMAAETTGGDAAVRATAGRILIVPRDRRPHPVRLLQRRAQRPGRLPVPAAPARPVRRRGPVAGLDPHHQGDRHRAALALGRHPPRGCG